MALFVQLLSVMMSIDVVNLSRVDLNLLLVFHLLMEERHVTRTAARMRITQGAVSSALNRLRKQFSDPLFERSRNGMVPTPKALSLAPVIGRALASIATELFEPPVFDPTASTTTFHLAMSDDIELVMLPYLLSRRESEGWTVQFSIHQTNSALWRDRMSDRRISAVIAPTPTHVPAEYQHRALFSSSYLMLFSPHQFGKTSLDLETFNTAEHIRVSYDAQRGFVDELMEARGSVRRVVASISHFAGVTPLLVSRPLVAIIPEYTARTIAATSDLVAQPVPVTVPRFSIAYLWRSDEETSADRAWLRRIVSEFRFRTGPAEELEEDDSAPSGAPRADAGLDRAR